MPTPFPSRQPQTAAGEEKIGGAAALSVGSFAICPLCLWLVSLRVEAVPFLTDRTDMETGMGKGLTQWAGKVWAGINWTMVRMQLLIKAMPIFN